MREIGHRFRAPRALSARWVGLRGTTSVTRSRVSEPVKTCGARSRGQWGPRATMPLRPNRGRRWGSGTRSQVSATDQGAQESSICIPVARGVKPEIDAVGDSPFFSRSFDMRPVKFVPVGDGALPSLDSRPMKRHIRTVGFNDHQTGSFAASRFLAALDLWRPRHTVEDDRASLANLQAG